MGTPRPTNMDSTRPSTGIITGAHLSALESAHNRHVAYDSSSEVSPKSSTERPLLNVSPGPCIEADPCMELGTSAERSTNTSSLSENEQTEDRHITVWNPLTGKKLSGNAAPFRRNLEKYLASHPDWEECLVTGDSKKRRKLSSCPSSTAQRQKTLNRLLFILGSACWPWPEFIHSRWRRGPVLLTVWHHHGCTQSRHRTRLRNAWSGESSNGFGSSSAGSSARLGES